MPMDLCPQAAVTALQLCCGYLAVHVMQNSCIHTHSSDMGGGGDCVALHENCIALNCKCMAWHCNIALPCRLSAKLLGAHRLMPELAIKAYKQSNTTLFCVGLHKCCTQGSGPGCFTAGENCFIQRFNYFAVCSTYCKLPCRHCTFEVKKRCNLPATRTLNNRCKGLQL